MPPAPPSAEIFATSVAEIASDPVVRCGATTESAPKRLSSPSVPSRALVTEATSITATAPPMAMPVAAPRLAT